MPTWAEEDHWEEVAWASSGRERSAPFASQESFATGCLIIGLRPGDGCIGDGLVGETYDRRPVSSWGFNKRIDEPLCRIFVGVFSFEYDGGAAEYPGGPPSGVDGRSITAVELSVQCEWFVDGHAIRRRDWENVMTFDWRNYPVVELQSVQFILTI